MRWVRRDEDSQRVYAERERFEVNLNALDRVGSSYFVVGSDSQNRLAVKHRLVCEPRLGLDRVPASSFLRRSFFFGCGRTAYDRCDYGQFVSRQNGVYARHSERLARIDMASPRVGIGLNSSFANSMPSTR